MSNAARNNILERLRQSAPGPKAPSSDFAIMEERQWPQQERTNRLVEKMGAVNTEIHLTTSEAWPKLLQDLLKAKNVQSLLYAKSTWAGEKLDDQDLDVEVSHCDREGFDLANNVFKVDASLTTTRGAVADAAALILWPTPQEPRTVSLVPPIHFALLEEEKISNSLYEVMIRDDWSCQMPTNALFISGPSKTADIEQELAYGVHGPKELIVLLIRS